MDVKSFAYKLIGWGFVLTVVLSPFGIIILELADIYEKL